MGRDARCRHEEAHALTAHAWRPLMILVRKAYTVKKFCFAALIIHLALAQLTPAQTGQILFERWQGSPFGDMSDLNAVRAFMASKPADVSQYLTAFDTGQNVADQYIGRISGWIVAPSTGNYTFWVASDDSSRVWLSSDQTPENAQFMCGIDGWSNYQSWDQYASQQSPVVTLSGGQGYWIEALWQEGGGGDHMVLAWQGPVGGRRVISGEYLSAVNPIAWLANHPTPVHGLGNVNAKHVVLQWQASEDPPAPVDFYEVYFSNDPQLLGQTSSLVATVQAGQILEHIVGRVAGGTQYAWRVDTILTTGERASGPVWRFTTDVEPVEVCPPDDPNGCSVGPIVINEIHFDPHVKTDLAEYVELHNVTEQTIDLSAWHFSNGVTHAFEPGASIGPRGFVVIAQNAEAFEAKFGFAPAGQFVGKLRNEGETVALSNVEGDLVDEVDYQLGFPWPVVGEAPGHSIQLINPGMDNELGGTWRPAVPTPGGNNGVLNANAPPILRQVNHTPNQPVGDEPVTVTVKATDADGVQAVMLAYQVVEPGDYFGVNDQRYSTAWQEVPMKDDGSSGDVTAGDHVFSVILPKDIQVHRRLIRYRVTAMDQVGLSIAAPYAEDPQPNFAYFVYDGVPAWTGAIQPGVNGTKTYGADVMQSLPIYHLISKKAVVETATWLQKHGGSNYKWKGTLVYDGEVYDHINFRARGGVWRYAMGKNMWKFDFLRAHYFQARDDYGDKYSEKWDKLNFSACIQQGSFGQRGEQGMIEALTFKMFNMAGVPAPKTHWLQFRIIDEAQEDGLLNAGHAGVTTSGTQYDGDLWGLYMAIEQMDGQFLDEHNLPDGNLYKMEARYGEKNNQGATAATDNSDIRLFKDTFETRPSEQWWGSSVVLDAYYSHVAVQHACHHGDVTSKNNFMYLNPELTTNEWGSYSRWWLLPWDADLTWTTYYGGMSDPFSRSGIQNHPTINMQMKNRAREISDLLFNQDQMGQLINEFAAIIDDPQGGPAMVDVDRAMWDYHWVMNTASHLSVSPSAKAGFDRFYKAAQNAGLERSFAGMCQLLKKYVDSRQTHMRGLHRDTAIPVTPQVQYIGQSDYAANDLVFVTSDFSDPQGAATFGGMTWRLARVNPKSSVNGPDGEPKGTLIPEGDYWHYFRGTAEPSGPGLWREVGFSDRPFRTRWLEDLTPIGYGETFIETELTDMSGAYTTVYLRKTFHVDDPAAWESLKLHIKYDDGFNAWINGTRVAWSNVNSENEPFDAVSTSTGQENHEFVEFVLSDPNVLQTGDNVLAVQVFNVGLSNSSDCFFDAKLMAVPVGTVPDSPSDADPALDDGHYYEIDTLWESDILTTFAESIQVPASVVKAGGMYRVRCRMMDTSGRWSHWSDPDQFQVAAPVAMGILQDLRITELMYNPADPPVGSAYDNDDFEFIELKNIGAQAIEDLSSVAFTDGFEFSFTGSFVTRLEPGEFVLVVRNIAAFESRYGTSLSDRIAGEYAGELNTQKLSNSGERIRLEDFWHGVIAEFEYSDKGTWPVLADGDGFSLVPLDSALPNQPEGSLDNGANWRASHTVHGSPGADDVGL